MPVWSTTLRPDTMIGQPLEKAEYERARMRDRKALRGTVIFCRHGATDYHPDRFYEDGEGPPLNRDGLAQAEALARWCVDNRVSVNALYISPTARTRETAAPVATALGLETQTMTDLAERSVGRWNGRMVDDVRREDPDAWFAWKEDPLRFVPPGGGESLEAFGRRVNAAVAQLLARHPGGVVLAVTHVGPIRAALCAALDCSLEHGKRLVIEPGSLTRVDFTTGWPNVVFMGVQPA